MADASQARKAPQQKPRKSPLDGHAPQRREAAARETTDTILVMIRRRPLPALALALGTGPVLGVASAR
jgi:hypothetical protein